MTEVGAVIGKSLGEKLVVHQRGGKGWERHFGVLDEGYPVQSGNS